MPNIIKENHYGVDVWSNHEMDVLRKTECLCLNCNDMLNCPTAKKLYEICRQDNMAMMITRCEKFSSKAVTINA